MKSLIVLVALVGGCTRVVYPGDGRLVLFEIDPGTDSCPIEDTTVGAVVRLGIHYWDVAGAQLRTVDQLTTDQQTVSAPRIRVHSDACSEINTSDTGTVGQYNYFTGDIQLFIKNWKGQSLLTAITDIAHEAGHAIGLDHVSENFAVMYKNPNPQTGLSDPDLLEHAKIWP